MSAPDLNPPQSSNVTTYNTRGGETEDEYVDYLDRLLKPVDLRKIRIPHATTPEYYDQFMEYLGVDFLLNTIAAGQLPAEIAVDLNIPVRTLTTWLNSRTGPEDRERARELCAESLVVKSNAVLLLPCVDSQEVAMAREYSKRLAWTAERLDSNMWGPPRPSAAEVAPTFSITVNSAPRMDVEQERAKLKETIIEHGPMTLESLKLIEN